MSNFISTDVEFQFIQVIQEVGIPAPESVIADGRLHRFNTGKRGDRNGWYIFFSDRNPAGSFGCWRRGISETWHAQKDSSLTTPEQRRELRRQMERDQRQRQRDVERGYRTAAERAKRLWNSCAPAPSSHPYLARKMIGPHGARATRKGWLALPILDFDQRLCSIQFISESGQKKLFPRGRKRGCHIPVAGSLDSNAPLAICEGFSTACTVATDHPGSCTIAAIDAGNLRNVCIGSRLKWLDREICVFGDDDKKSPTNPGRVKATEAAKVADCQLEFPVFPEGAPDHLTDFNDLFVWKSRGSANE